LLKGTWQQKSDDELVAASEHLSEYTKEAEEVIRVELRRRGMSEPGPTVRTIGNEQSSQPVNSDMKSIMNNRKTLSIIIAIIGVALIIISPSLVFTETTHYKLTPGFPDMMDFHTNTQLKDLAFLGGIALLIVGGIIAAVGFSQSTSTQPPPPPMPTTQPVTTQTVSPKSVELGNTPDEVQLVMGQPDKIIKLGARVIHVYKDMKIVYIDSKVSDVQLS
jgi:hypothetical protein